MMKRKQKALAFSFILFLIYQYIAFTNRTLNNKTAVHTNHTLVVQFDRPKVKHEEFCVIAAVFNPASYQSRYESYRKFVRHIQTFGVNLITVELAIGNQTFQVTDADNPNHIQLKTDDVLWYKENLINIGIRRSPIECEYISWIDVEVEFTDKYWVHKSIVALDAFKIIQPYDDVAILGPDSKPIEARKSFAKCYAENVSYKDPPHMKEIYDKFGIPWKENENHFCATGFAWVARKSVLLQTGGLYDRGIVGAGDYMTIHSFLGIMAPKNPAYIMGEFLDDVLEYQVKTSAIINGSFGYVKGSLTHSWHGAKEDRGYGTRIKIIVNDKLPYSPKKHVYYDEQGLLRFKPASRSYFLPEVTRFFNNRNEDFKDV